MPVFEVYIPQGGQPGVTLRVEADNWIDALKSGMWKLGQTRFSTVSLLCDVKEDGSIHVTDQRLRKVFKIVEIHNETSKASALQPTKIGRELALEPVEQVLAELFGKVQVIWEIKEKERALSTLLNLAMEKIPAESGSVFLGGPGQDFLECATARGPKADEFLRLGLQIPMGVGIVGFCASEGVGIAISDAESDNRFYRQISDYLGYETKSVLCAPICDAEYSLGCIELLNRKNGSTFSHRELAILSYLANQTAVWLGWN